jgi:mevalonate kinase
MKSKGVVTDTSTLQKEYHLSEGSQAWSARPSGSGGGGCSSMEMKMCEKWYSSTMTEVLRHFNLSLMLNSIILTFYLLLLL